MLFTYINFKALKWFLQHNIVRKLLSIIILEIHIVNVLNKYA